jgi:hypothetical protein
MPNGRLMSENTMKQDEKRQLKVSRRIDVVAESIGQVNLSEVEYEMWVDDLVAYFENPPRPQADQLLDELDLDAADMNRRTQFELCWDIAQEILNNSVDALLNLEG